MAKDITWVALDAHKKKHAVAVLAPGKEIQEFTVANEAKAIRRLARKLVREAPGRCGCATRRVPAGSCSNGSSRRPPVFSAKWWRPR